VIGSVAHEASGVDATEVQRTRGLELAGVEAEGVQEQLIIVSGTILILGSVRVVVGGHGGEMGIHVLEVRHIRAVNLQLQLVVNTSDGERRTVGSRQGLHGMVEVNLLDPGLRGDRTLGLGDEHVLRGGRKRHALVSVQVHVVGVALPLVREGSTPRDANLNVVVLEGDEGNGGLPILTEGEAEGVKLTLGSFGETSLGLGEALGEDGRCDVLGESGGLVVDHLTTDEKLHLGNLTDPVGGGELHSTGPVVGGEVHIAEHVTLALEADRGHTIGTGVALDDLTFDGLGKVRVTLVVGTEKGNLGLPDDVCILGTNGNELGNSTGHVYI